MIQFMLNMPVKCKCCGHDVGKKDGKICSDCFMIWYDYGLTDGCEIGRCCNYARANGFWPFDIHKLIPTEKFKDVIEGVLV